MPTCVGGKFADSNVHFWIDLSGPAGFLVFLAVIVLQRVLPYPRSCVKTVVFSSVAFHPFPSPLARLVTTVSQFELSFALSEVMLACAGISPCCFCMGFLRPPCYAVSRNTYEKKKKRK